MFLGMDFGTSFSQMATVHNGTAVPLWQPGDYGVPSEFYYDKQVGVKVGTDALDYAEGVNAKWLVSDCKMKLKNVPNYEVLDGQKFTYAEMAKQIVNYVVRLGQMVANTKTIPNKDKIEGVVVTVPARFTYQERELIKEAVETCMGATKLPVMDVIKEPVAAAISYFKDTAEDGETILVFDLGGGTCDVSLVKADKAAKERFTVIGEPGMELLGGRDWDKALIEYISATVERNTGVRIADHEYYRKQLKTQCWEVKRKLSQEFNVTTPTVTVSMQDGTIQRIPVGLGMFEELTMNLMNRAIQCAMNVMDSNTEHYQAVHKIVCVGGSSNMLQVKKRLEQAFPHVEVCLYEPERAVVNGAAIYADMLRSMPEAEKATLLSDVAAFSYGVRAYEDYSKDKTKMNIYNVVKKGDRLPASGFQDNFHPTADNVEQVSFKIFESNFTDEQFDANLPCTYVGEVTMKLPPNCPKTYSARCDMTLKSDGFLDFKATGKDGRKVETTFKVCK